MAKEKRVKLYNKGTRNWTLKDGKENATCAPGRCVDLDKSQADKLMKAYPADFIFSGDVPVKGTKEVKNLKAKVTELEKENATLRQQIISRDEKITELKGGHDEMGPETESGDTQGD